MMSNKHRTIKRPKIRTDCFVFFIKVGVQVAKQRTKFIIVVLDASQGFFALDASRDILVWNIFRLFLQALRLCLPYLPCGLLLRRQMGHGGMKADGKWIHIYYERAIFILCGVSSLVAIETETNRYFLALSYTQLNRMT